MAVAEPTQQQTCPQDYMRKTAPAAETSPPYVTRADGTWEVRGFDEVRQILRSEFTRQAGFGAEQEGGVEGGLMQNPPILYLEGKPHHQARRETNRFFTPSTTDRDYREFMDAYADELIAELQRQGRMDLSALSMEMATQVASRIVGLTDSWFPSGLKSRLEAMIEAGDKMLDDNIPFIGKMRSQVGTLKFFTLDVLPAVRARKQQRQEDVISYLLDQNYSNLEIMTECLVYGVAGMVTTREFIAVALWHLLENPGLRQRMLVGEQAERYAILHEILRLEPVVSHLYRRTTAPLTFESDGETVEIPAGTLLDLHLRAANADERAMGDAPDALCPMRERTPMRPKVPEFGLSFGDGAHRCPGAYVAIQESDILLRKLLALPTLRIEGQPSVSEFRIAESYEVRDIFVAVD